MLKKQSSMPSWLVVARDEEMRGFRVLRVQANTIKSAYDRCIEKFLKEEWGTPGGMNAFELGTSPREQQELGELLFNLFDPRPRAGLFNGNARLIEPGYKPDVATGPLDLDDLFPPFDFC